VDPPQAMAHHRVDGCPDGAVAQGRVWSRRVVDDVAHTTVVTPARDAASGLEEVTAVGWFHARSSHEAMLPTPNMTQLSSRVCGMSVTAENQCRWGFLLTTTAIFSPWTTPSTTRSSARIRRYVLLSSCLFCEADL
jgi:hypothetical protein